MTRLHAGEPLVLRTAIVTAIVAVIHLGVVLGALPIDVEQEQAIAGTIDLVGVAVAVVWSRAAVTPVTGKHVAD